MQNLPVMFCRDKVNDEQFQLKIYILVEDKASFISKLSSDERALIQESNNFTTTILRFAMISLHFKI